MKMPAAGSPRQLLPYLLDLSKIDLFYTNKRAVHYVLEFTTSTLINFHDVYAKDVLVKLLSLLKQLFIGVITHDKLNDVLPDLTGIFDILLYLSELNIFCPYCASICEPLLQELLKAVKDDYESIDQMVFTILDNFKKIGARREVLALSTTASRRFPLNSKSYNYGVRWLMEDSVNVLKTANVTCDELYIAEIIDNMCPFVTNAEWSIRSQHQYYELVGIFLKELMDNSPKLIALCCKRKAGRSARKLLGLVLHEFLREQDIMSNDTERITVEEIAHFPMQVRDWPKNCSRTFFYLCHLLCHHEKSVWSGTVICNAIGRVMQHETLRRMIDVPVMKSICFIFPFTLTGHARVRKRRMIGDDILNMQTKFAALLHRILSLSAHQLLWIMLKGSQKIKLLTVKFWLSKGSEGNLQTLRDVLITTKSENIILNVLLCLIHSQDDLAYRAIEVIQSLHSPILRYEIPELVAHFSSNIDAVIKLIQACDNGMPADKNLVIELFEILYLVLASNPSDDVVINMCRYASNLLYQLKSDKDIINSLCSDLFWIRYPASRLCEDNEELIITCLEFLARLLKYQTKPFYVEDPVLVNLTPLLKKSEDVAEKTISLLCLLLNVNKRLKLQEESILNTLHALCDVSIHRYVSPKVYDCLKGLIKVYSLEIINSPMLAMLVERRCQFVNRKYHSAACLKFIMLWIKVMYNNPHKNICCLPEKDIITTFIKRSAGLEQSTVIRYLKLISKIYEHEDYESDIDYSGFSINFNLPSYFKIF